MAELIAIIIIIIPLLDYRLVEERGFAYKCLIITSGMLLKGQGSTNFKRHLPFPKTSPEKKFPTSSGKQEWHHERKKKNAFQSESLDCPRQESSLPSSVS